MRTIKLSIIALILACSFQVANAQVRVGVSIGTPPPPPHRVVVVHRPPVYHRPVVVRSYPVRHRSAVYYRNGHRYYQHPHHRVVRRHW